MRHVLILCCCCAIVASAQGSSNSLTVVSEIKAEAFNNSQVMDTLYYLSDMYGPRLTASPEFNEAAKWAMDRLKSYGIQNIHEEPWGPFGRSWSIESYTVDMMTPRYSHLVAAPLAWSGPTNGPVTGDVIEATMPAREYNPQKLSTEIQEFETKWKGKLKGKVVLVTTPPHEPPSAQPDFRRYTDEELASLAKAPLPVAKKKIDFEHLDVPSDPNARREFFQSLSAGDVDKLLDRLDAERAKLSAFLRDEGVLAVLRADPRAHNGLDFAEAAGSKKASAPQAPPTFIVTDEQYSRMSRLLAKNAKVTVRVDLKVKESEKDQMAQDIVGEIPGSSKPDEVVMIGAHFDSWHTGTGATDNGAGSAVMIEVMRVLKKLNLPLNRTVRIGLWSGEEQGLYGSKAYVKQHFADPKTMK
jgi:hypothetical protein